VAGGIGGGGGQFQLPIGGRTGGGGSIIPVILVCLPGWYFGFDPSQILGAAMAPAAGPGGGQSAPTSGGHGQLHRAPANDR